MTARPKTTKSTTASEPQKSATASEPQKSTTAEPKDWSPGKPGYTRRYPRFALDVRIQVRMFQGGDFHNCWGRSTELGQDGIGATLTGDLEAGEIVTLDIPLPLSPYPLKVRAIVRYRHGLHYGFEFLTLNEPQRDTLRRVCQMLATKT